MNPSQPAPQPEAPSGNPADSGSAPPSDLLMQVRTLSNMAEFNRWLGLEVVTVAPGDVQLQLRWRCEFGQYNGFLHAGIVAALLDTACGFAAYTLSGGGLLASQFAARFLRPSVAETFLVRGRVIKSGRQQFFAAAELTAFGAPPDRLLAVGDAVLVVPEQRSA